MLDDALPVGDSGEVSHLKESRRSKKPRKRSLALFSVIVEAFPKPVLCDIAIFNLEVNIIF